MPCKSVKFSITYEDSNCISWYGTKCTYTVVNGIGIIQRNKCQTCTVGHEPYKILNVYVQPNDEAYTVPVGITTGHTISQHRKIKEIIRFREGIKRLLYRTAHWYDTLHVKINKSTTLLPIKYTKGDGDFIILSLKKNSACQLMSLTEWCKLYIYKHNLVQHAEEMFKNSTVQYKLISNLDEYTKCFECTSAELLLSSEKGKIIDI